MAHFLWLFFDKNFKYLYSKIIKIRSSLFSRPDGVEVLMEVDRKARGFIGLLAEALDVDESLVWLFVTEWDTPQFSRPLIGMVNK